jgi:hypothetical protein
MQTSPQTASSYLQVPPCGIERVRQMDDLAYQAMTVASILLVLGSLWIF